VVSGNQDRVASWHGECKIASDSAVYGSVAGHLKRASTTTDNRSATAVVRQESNALMLEHVEVVEGIAHFRPRCTCSLVEAVDLISLAIAYCRDRRIPKLFIDATGLEGVPPPSLIDRFLMVEAWAQESKRLVAVVLVVHVEYIHPQKFGVMAAADFGMIVDVFTSETDALKWLTNASARA